MSFLKLEDVSQSSLISRLRPSMRWLRNVLSF